MFSPFGTIIYTEEYKIKTRTEDLVILQILKCRHFYYQLIWHMPLIFQNTRWHEMPLLGKEHSSVPLVDWP